MPRIRFNPRRARQDPDWLPEDDDSPQGRLEDEPVEPTSDIALDGRGPRRNRRRAAIAVGVGLVGALGAFTWGRARRTR